MAAIQVGYDHYKFQTEKDYQSVHIQGNFIRLADLKQRIFQSRFRDRRRGVQLVAFHAQTGEQYPNDNTDLIMKNTSLIIQRLPVQRLLPIIADDEIDPNKNSTPIITPPCQFLHAAVDLDDFGDDPFAAPQPPKPATDTYMQEADAVQGSSRSQELEFALQGYVCRRCGIPGHLIQQCPTNADTILCGKKRWIKPLAVAVSVSEPGEAAFDRFVEGMSSSSSSSSRTSVVNLPPELYCPLCKQVMKDAVIASKCCYDSFCDRCIRNQIMSKSACICKATITRPDNLLPNMTLRETIARLLESKPNSSISGSSAAAQTTTSHIQSADLKKPTPLNQHEKQHKLHPRSSLEARGQGQDQKRQKKYSFPAMSHATGPYNNLPVWNVAPQGHFWGRQANSVSVV